MSGWVRIERALFDHPCLQDSVFSKHAAWIWLIAEAAYSGRRVKGPSGPIELKRGEISHSIRFLASKWGWSAGKVRRFLDALEADTAISTRTEQGQIHLTICNYDKYQSIAHSDGTPVDTAPDTHPEQGRTQREKQGNKETISPNGEKGARLKSSQSRATRLPCDWQPSADLVDYAKGQGLHSHEIHKCVEDIRDWSASSKTGVKLDWSATWRSWVRREAEAKGRAPVEAAATSISPQVFVEAGTDEWRAWKAHKGGRVAITEEKRDDGTVRRGWYFPARWPPAAPLPRAVG